MGMLAFGASLPNYMGPDSDPGPGSAGSHGSLHHMHSAGVNASAIGGGVGGSMGVAMCASLSLGARLARDQVDTVVSCPHHK